MTEQINEFSGDELGNMNDTQRGATLLLWQIEYIQFGPSSPGFTTYLSNSYLHSRDRA